MQKTYKDIIKLNNDLNQLKNVSAEATHKVLDLKEEIDAHLEKYQDAFLALMDTYKIEPKDDVYNWAESEEVEVISAKVQKLLKTSVELTKTNTLSRIELMALTQGLPMGLIAEVKNVLVK